MEKSDKKTKYAGRTKQQSIYVGKFLRLFIAERQWLMLIMSAVIAVLVSVVVGRNINKTMEGTLLGGLAVSCVCLWNGVFNSIQVVCKERSIIKREHRSGLSISAYMSSHMIIQFIICILQSVIMLVVMKLTGVLFPKEGLITPFYVIDMFISVLLATYAADMMGLMVSCLVKDTTMAMTVMPFILIVQLLFAGVAFPLSGKAAALSDFTITKWGVSAVCIQGNYNELPTVSIYHQVKSICQKDDTLYELFMKMDGSKLTHFMSRFMQKPEYEYVSNNLWHVWGMLLAFIVVFAAMGVIFLKFIDKDKRS